MIKKIITFMIILIAASFSNVYAREIEQRPHWEKQTISVYIPEDNKSAASMMKSAFQRWQNVSAGHIKFNYLQQGPADIDVIFSDSASSADSPISNTTISSNGNSITKSEINIASENNSFKNLDRDYISKVMQHEVGKALGVPINTKKKTSIMYIPVDEKQNIMKIDAIKLFSISEWSYGTRKINK